MSTLGAITAAWAASLYPAWHGFSCAARDPVRAQEEVLKGVLKPAQCKLFGNECTPEHPIGALMVSSEGSCAAYYNYEHRKTSLTSIDTSVPVPA